MAEVAASGVSGERGPASESMLDAALSYARRGWRVFPVHTPVGDGCSCGASPCAARGKHPRIMGGLKVGTVDEGTIERWWDRWPDANIGICTGSASGLCVLDVDGALGNASLAALGASRRVPDTLAVRTGRAEANGARLGEHLYLRYPLGVLIRNSNAKLGPGLDIRGTNGYVVAPPSLHPSGVRYEWRNATLPPAEMPEWLVQELEEALPVTSHLAATDTLREGVRNDRLFRLACARRRKGDNEHVILQHLITQNQARCFDPLPKLELASLAANAAKYPVGGPDPLDEAWAKVVAERHTSLEAQLLALALHLQDMRGEFPVALPQVRIAALMRCDPTLVSRYRRRLEQRGRLIPVAKYIARKMAALYRVV